MGRGTAPVPPETVVGLFPSQSSAVSLVPVRLRFDRRVVGRPAAVDSDVRRPGFGAVAIDV
jgi:hypothetical protein